MANYNVRYLVIDTSVAYAANKGATTPPKGDMLLLQYISTDRACRIVMSEAEDWPISLGGKATKSMLGIMEEWEAELEAFRKKDKPSDTDIVFLTW